MKRVPGSKQWGEWNHVAIRPQKWAILVSENQCRRGDALKRSTPPSNLDWLSLSLDSGTRPAAASKSVVLSTGFLPVPAVKSKPVTDNDRKSSRVIF